MASVGGTATDQVTADRDQGLAAIPSASIKAMTSNGDHRLLAIPDRLA
jgi:hypothetical protein